jgi:hypothetical protein
MRTVTGDQPSNRPISAAVLPNVARISTHWIRWYSVWLLAVFNRSANRSIVALSLTISGFIFISYSTLRRCFNLFGFDTPLFAAGLFISQIEARQFGTVGRFFRAAALFAVIGWRILYATLLAWLESDLSYLPEK